MSITQEKILEFLQKHSSKPIKAKKIAKGINISPSQYKEFKRVIKSLKKEGKIAKVEKGFVIADSKPANIKTVSVKSASTITGHLSMNKNGYGFVVPNVVADFESTDTAKDDIYIHSQYLHTALDGDEVLVRIFPPSKFYKGNKREGEIIKVIKRAKEHFVGTFHRVSKFCYVQPDDPKILKDIYVISPSDELEDGVKVVIKLEEWNDPNLNPSGKIVELLGSGDEPGMDITIIMRKYGLYSEFPDDVMKEVDKIPDYVLPSEINGRLDLRSERCFTIDGADAKDFDDAVSIKILDNGNYLLGVHIADVSHYVIENSALDIEALKRGTSVYLVDRAVPMLPKKLSNGICSLNPNEDRLTISVFMEYNQSGKLKNFNIEKTIIKSCARLTYDDVQSVFDEEDGKSVIGNQLAVGDNQYSIKDDLLQMRELSNILFKNRVERGGLDFDIPEAKVELDEQGNPIALGRRERWESHRLIEDFMLSANETVAKFMFKNSFPSLYRIHETPDDDKLSNLETLLKTLGYNIKISGKVEPKDLQSLTNRVKGEPREKVINMFILRSLKLACYSSQNLGHFGLALKYYTHFTSPIRRYPDLIVHRLLKELLELQHQASNIKYQESNQLSVISLPSVQKRISELHNKLPRIAEISSERERNAMEAERESVKIKQVKYLSERLGDEYNGIITNVTSYGFFVELDDILAEGLVHIDSLMDDYYDYDVETQTLIGEKYKRRFKIGDIVKVIIANVNISAMEIDLNLVEERKNKNNKKGKRRRTKRR